MFQHSTSRYRSILLKIPLRNGSVDLARSWALGEPSVQYPHHHVGGGSSEGVYSSSLSRYTWRLLWWQCDSGEHPSRLCCRCLSCYRGELSCSREADHKHHFSPAHVSERATKPPTRPCSQGKPTRAPSSKQSLSSKQPSIPQTKIIMSPRPSLSNTTLLRS